ncbi:MAG TPA: type II secretion system protein [Phycisphaerales bacterium]|nr:type II secretion system protein [Phycisphaerales bacterium]
MTMRKAFTLLEVLISIVVLAIGLVGAVAIFPAVIDLQRRAQDAVVGTSAASSAEAEIVGTLVNSTSLDWTDWTSLPTRASIITREDMFPVFDLLRSDRAISTTASGGNTLGNPRRHARLDFGWETDWTWPRSNNKDALTVLRSTGDLIIGGGIAGRPIITTRNVLPEYTIPLSARLMPDAASGAPPRYVYDFIVRRVDAGIGIPSSNPSKPFEKNVPWSRMDELPLQFAVFVRRIDRSIRVPAGKSLRDVLTGGNGIAPKDRRFPLAVAANDMARPIGNARSDGQGSGSATPVYSTPLAAGLRPESIRQSVSGSSVWDELDPSTLRIDPTRDAPASNESVVDALTQVGQMFIDNTGVVRRVTKIKKRRINGTLREILTIEPPFSSSSNLEYRQIVFTPQVPVDIRVITAR